MALSDNGRDPLLLGHLAYGGVVLLLPDRNPQDDPQAMDHKGLKTAYMRLEEDSTLQAVQQGWEDAMLRTLILVLILILHRCHKMWYSDWKADEAHAHMHTHTHTHTTHQYKCLQRRNTHSKYLQPHTASRDRHRYTKRLLKARSCSLE